MFWSYYSFPYLLSPTFHIKSFNLQKKIVNKQKHTRNKNVIWKSQMHIILCSKSNTIICLCIGIIGQSTEWIWYEFQWIPWIFWLFLNFVDFFFILWILWIPLNFVFHSVLYPMVGINWFGEKCFVLFSHDHRYYYTRRYYTHIDRCIIPSMNNTLYFIHHFNSNHTKILC